MISSNAQVWDSLASGYDTRRSQDPVYLACSRAVVARLGKLKTGSQVLDAGCGTGFATLLLPRDCRVSALDYSAQSLDVLQAKLAHYGRTADLRVGDIRSLPYADHSFDAVLCANTLQHLSPGADQKLAISELFRVLKPGGRFSFSMHHYSADKKRAGWIKEGKPGEPGIDYIFRYSYQDVRELIPHAKVASVGYYGWPSLVQDIATKALGGYFARRGLGTQLIAYG